MSRFATQLVCLAALALPGCGDGDGPTLAPVSGTVTYQGKPVEGAQVTFSTAGAPLASATTDNQGRFQLTTRSSGDGAAIGKHKVSVAKYTKRDPHDTSPYAEMKPVLPVKYERPANTRLTAEVTPDGPNDFTFTLVD
jgi:hypothetical protein